MSDITRINIATPTDETMINRSSMDITTINPTLSSGSYIQAGTVLLNKYVIDKSLDVTSGEALLYVCRYDSKRYIAKIYNRRESIKPTDCQAKCNTFSKWTSYGVL